MLIRESGYECYSRKFLESYSHTEGIGWRYTTGLDKDEKDYLVLYTLDNEGRSAVSNTDPSYLQKPSGIYKVHDRFYLIVRIVKRQWKVGIQLGLNYNIYRLRSGLMKPMQNKEIKAVLDILNSGVLVGNETEYSDDDKTIVYNSRYWSNKRRLYYLDRPVSIISSKGVKILLNEVPKHIEQAFLNE